MPRSPRERRRDQAGRRARSTRRATPSRRGPAAARGLPAAPDVASASALWQARRALTTEPARTKERCTRFCTWVRDPKLCAGDGQSGQRTPAGAAVRSSAYATVDQRQPDALLLPCTPTVVHEPAPSVDSRAPG
jgi:hypothetical protein